MSTAGPLLVVVAFGIALFVLSQPFWPGQEERAAEVDALRRADLEAAKVAKYREIRDAALDHDTGKLSDADWKPIDARLRAEAVAILDELDGLDHVRGATAEGPGDRGGPAGDARTTTADAADPAPATAADGASAPDDAPATAADGTKAPDDALPAPADEAGAADDAPAR